MSGDFTVTNSGQGRQMLTQFDAFEKESEGMQRGPLEALKELGATLEGEQVRAES